MTVGVQCPHKRDHAVKQRTAGSESWFIECQTAGQSVLQLATCTIIPADNFSLLWLHFKMPNGHSLVKTFYIKVNTGANFHGEYSNWRNMELHQNGLLYKCYLICMHAYNHARRQKWYVKECACNRVSEVTTIQTAFSCLISSTAWSCFKFSGIVWNASFNCDYLTKFHVCRL